MKRKYKLKSCNVFAYSVHAAAIIRKRPKQFHREQKKLDILKKVTIPQLVKKVSKFFGT